MPLQLLTDVLQKTVENEEQKKQKQKIAATTCFKKKIPSQFYSHYTHLPPHFPFPLPLPTPTPQEKHQLRPDC